MHTRIHVIPTEEYENLVETQLHQSQRIHVYTRTPAYTHGLTTLYMYTHGLRHTHTDSRANKHTQIIIDGY